MKLFITLLWKDLRRVLRNPVPILILLGIPVAITSMIGLVFGGSGSGQDAIAPIRLGIVDEDDSLFSQFLRGAAGQDEFSERIQITFLEDEASGVRLIQDGKLSAVLRIPEGFTEAFVRGENGVKLYLIKNPSEWIYPTLAQEGADVIVSALNALIRNFQKDLQELHGLIDSERDFDFFRDVLAVSTLIERARNRLDAAEVYLNPPLVSYERESSEADAVEEGDASQVEASGEFNAFAYILIGTTAMFLLMIADNCMRDLYREYRNRTFDRYRTFRDGLWILLAEKSVYAVVVLLLASLILLGGGSLIFGFSWSQLGPTLLLILCYSLFAAGFMGFIAALAGKERRADMFNTMIVIFLAAVGGSMWPAESLPPFLGKYVTPLSPTYWFGETLRSLQMQPEEANWVFHTALLGFLAIGMISAASWIFRFRLEKGIKE